jgi:diketogulonate reductase-like aldo/keto reductase
MTDSVVPTDTHTLPGGGRMPLLGFGTWQIKGEKATRATAAALEAGYRHLDTAMVYGNESEVGRALTDSGVDRDDVFVTTKCPPNRAGQELETLHRSLEKLGTDHVDLWLVHWPGEADLGALWSAFVTAQQQGLARDIGVSNFSAEQIDEVERATGVRPAVNQIEWSPLLYRASIVTAHRDRGVVLEGYSALRGGTLTHPTITGIAERLGRTPAQVIIRWHLEHGTVVIPKSENPDRIRSNAAVGDFTLSADDVAALDGLGQEA